MSLPHHPLNPTCSKAATGREDAAREKGKAALLRLAFTAFGLASLAIIAVLGIKPTAADHMPNYTYKVIDEAPAADGSSVVGEQDPDTASIRLASPTENTSDEVAFEPGQVLVRIAEGQNVDEALGSIAALECVSDCTPSPEGSAGGSALVHLAEGTSEDEAIALLASQPYIAHAQLNHVYHLLEPFPSLPGALVGNTGSLQALTYPEPSESEVNDPEADPATGKQRTALGLVHAYGAWKLTRCEQTVTIAVLDTGCDIEHPDLAANVISDAAYDARIGSSNVSDSNGHGTHVAGIAAAVTGNGKGIAGLSYNARILPVKVINDSGNVNSFDACKGLEYVLKCVREHPEYNIRVVNMSFGGKVTSADYDDQAVICVIEKLRNEGVLTIAAAGNADSSHDEVPPFRSWPGDFSDSVISVINASDAQQRSSSSNYNQTGQMAKTICAPGTGIYSTVAGGLHDSGSSDYGLKSGTSMASPGVAGIAALLFAADPSLSPAEATAILYATASDMGAAGFDADTGFGMIDAEGAVNMALGTARLRGETTLLAGGKANLALTGTEGNVTWHTSNPSIAQVDETGTLTGVAPGYAIISASSDEGSFPAVVEVHALSVSGSTLLKEGSNAAWKASSALPAVWTWSSSDENVATVNSSGRVFARKAGTATISATLSSNDQVRISRTITVSPATIDIASASVTGLPTCTYTGDIHAPVPTVAVNGIMLKHGLDFTLSFRNNVNAGNATVTIAGKGEYSGSVSRSFVIRKATIDKAVLQKVSFAYDGSAKKPRPNRVTSTVKDERSGISATLVLDSSDYSIAYTNSKGTPITPVKAGTYYAKISGKGNFSGSKSVKFSISKAKQPWKIGVALKTLTAKSLTKKARSVKPFSIKAAKGSLSYRKISGNSKLAVNKKTGAITVKKGTRHGIYAAKVKIIAAGNGNFTAASKTLTATIKVK